MKLPLQYIAALVGFGYTEREAQFLYIVATFSGYFIQRQFLGFIGAQRGKRSNLLAQKIINNGHASGRDYLGYGPIYHLSSRTFYSAIGKENIRNRREHSFEFIRTRLVLLDFLLARQDQDYFETEQDKVQFFCETLGLSLERLPAKVYEGGPSGRPRVRHFVDGFPLFLAPPLADLSPVVTFTYVDSGTRGPSRFAAHLSVYRALLQELNSFRYLFISPKPSQFQSAAERFRSALKRPVESDISTEILRYFEIRRKWEEKQYIVPVTEDLEFLRDAKAKFEGDHYDGLYSAWRFGCLTEEALRKQFCQLKPERTVYFETVYVREHRSYLERSGTKGERCMKDTVHPSVHRFVHPAGERKC
jgi:hypothetical protein